MLAHIDPMIPRSFWFWAAYAAAAANAAFGIYAAVIREPMHAFIHGAIAVTFGVIGVTLKRRRSVRHVREDQVLLEESVTDLERQLAETQARLDFADQLLRQRSTPESELRREP